MGLMIESFAVRVIQRPVSGRALPSQSRVDEFDKLVTWICTSSPAPATCEWDVRTKSTL